MEPSTLPIPQPLNSPRAYHGGCATAGTASTTNKIRLDRNLIATTSKSNNLPTKKLKSKYATYPKAEPSSADRRPKYTSHSIAGSGTAADEDDARTWHQRTTHKPVGRFPHREVVSVHVAVEVAIGNQGGAP